MRKIYNVGVCSLWFTSSFLVFIYHTLIFSNMKNSVLLSSSLAIFCLLWPIMFDVHLQKSLYNYKERKKVFIYKLFVNIICTFVEDLTVQWSLFIFWELYDLVGFQIGCFYEFCLTIKITSIFFSFLRVTKMTNQVTFYAWMSNARSKEVRSGYTEYLVLYRKLVPCFYLRIICCKEIPKWLWNKKNINWIKILLK